LSARPAPAKHLAASARRAGNGQAIGSVQYLSLSFLSLNEIVICTLPLLAVIARRADFSQVFCL